MVLSGANRTKMRHRLHTHMHTHTVLGVQLISSFWQVAHGHQHPKCVCVYVCVCVCVCLSSVWAWVHVCPCIAPPQQKEFGKERGMTEEKGWRRVRSNSDIDVLGSSSTPRARQGGKCQAVPWMVAPLSIAGALSGDAEQVYTQIKRTGLSHTFKYIGLLKHMNTDFRFKLHKKKHTHWYVSTVSEYYSLLINFSNHYCRVIFCRTVHIFTEISD